MAFISESEAQRFFDEEFYLENNPDVETAVNNNVFDSGFEHFLDFGISENRAPSDALTFFSEDDYLEDNPDVEQAVNAGTFESGLDHFLSFGVNELDVRGESTGYEFFNNRSYLNENRDVDRAVEDGVFDSGLEHYLEFGFSEGRSGLFTIGSADSNLLTEEGETLTFTVESINGGSVGRDTEVAFSLAGDIDLGDIAGDSLTSTATIEEGSSSADLSVELAQDLTTEGLETISASASVLGDDSLETDEIIIQDTSTAPNVTGVIPNPITTINETDNSSLSFAIETENASEGDTVNLNFSGDIDNDDVEGELPETATVGTDGTATINLNFVADQSEEGNETFTLAASIGDEAVTSRTVTVEDTSLPPEVTEVSASQTTVNETDNNSLSFTIATENAAEGDTVDLSFGGTVTADDVEGDLPETATVGADGNASFSLTFSADQTTEEGPETLTASASIGDQQPVASDEVTVEDTSVNTPPEAANDQFSTEQGAELTISAQELLANDTDEDGDTLSIASTSAVENGTLEESSQLSPVGSIQHQGTVTFNDEITVGNFSVGFNSERTGDNSSGFFVQDNVSFNTPLFDVSNPDSFTVEDSTLNLSGADLLVSSELAQLLSDQGLASEDLTGADVGDVQIEAALSESDSGELTVEDGVTSVSLDAELLESAAGLTLSGTDSEATPAEGFDVGFGITEETDFTLEESISGFTFTPNEDFTGEGSFQYTVSDGQGGTDTATVSINVEEPTFEVEANNAGGVNVTVTSDEGVEIDSGIVSSAFPDIAGSDLSGPDNIVGAAGTDNLFGEGGNDTISGGQASDFLVGGAGADSLDGGQGNDNVVGGAGDDTLNGGAGADTLNGGEGADTITLAAAAESSPDAADTINGFVAGEDQIDLSAIGEDLTFGDNVALQDGTLSGPGFAIALADLQGELSAEDLIGVSVNTPPEAANDQFSTEQGAELTISAQELLANDTDEDGDTLSIASTSAVENGTLEESSQLSPVEGSIQHQGTVTFNEEITVGNFGVGFNSERAGDNSSGFFVQDNVSFNTPLFDVSNPDSFTVEDSTLSLSGADLLVSSEFAQLLSDQGLASEDLTGADVGDVQIEAAVSESDSGELTVEDGVTSVSLDTQLLENAAGLSLTGTDSEASAAEGFDVGFGITEETDLTLEESSSFTFTPNEDFTGEGSFQYTVNDGNGGTDTATVSIDVQGPSGPVTEEIGPEQDGSSFDATAGDITYDIATGNYSFTVNGFDADDVLDVADLNNPGVTVQPDSDQSDGNQTISFDDPESGNVVNVTLGELTPEQDSAIFNEPTFVDEFGEDSLILS